MCVGVCTAAGLHLLLLRGWRPRSTSVTNALSLQTNTFSFCYHCVFLPYMSLIIYQSYVLHQSHMSYIVHIFCPTKSTGIKACLCLYHCLFVGQVMTPHHSDQMSQKSQVSRIALWACFLNGLNGMVCLEHLRW